MVQKQIHVTEEVYNLLSEVKGEYMSFTNTTLYLIKQRKEYIVLQCKYECACEEIKHLKAKIKKGGK